MLKNQKAPIKSQCYRHWVKGQDAGDSDAHTAAVRKRKRLCW